MFYGFQNTVLEEVSIKGSNHKEYTFLTDYFVAMLSILPNLKSLELFNINFIESPNLQD